MIANNPERVTLQDTLQYVGAAQSVYDQWAEDGAHSTNVPKSSLDYIIRQGEQVKRLAALTAGHELQRLTPHFNKLAASRRLLARETVSEAEKRAIIPRVNRCLTQLRAEIETLLHRPTA